MENVEKNLKKSKKRTKIKPGFRFIRKIRGLNTAKMKEKEDWFEKQLEEIEKQERRKRMMRISRKFKQINCDITFYKNGRKTTISITGFKGLKIDTVPEGERVFWR